jgi:Phage integrase family
VRALCNRLAAKAGIDKRVHPHGLRHGWALAQVQSGTSLNAIQQLLGHRSLHTTSVYLQHIAPAAAYFSFVVFVVCRLTEFGDREGRVLVREVGALATVTRCAGVPVSVAREWLAPGFGNDANSPRTALYASFADVAAADTTRPADGWVRTRRLSADDRRARRRDAG